MGAAAYIKRVGRYILKGVPKVNVNISVGSMSYGKAFEGKTVLVTGGNSGIGYCTAKKCLEEGAAVLISGRDEERCKKAVKDLGGKADYVICDFEKTENIPAMMEKAFQKLGRIDYLVCNAGICHWEKTLFDVTQNLWDSYINTNLKSAYFVVQEYLKRKKEGEEGAVVFTSSDWSVMGGGADKPYAITKGAINSMTMGLSCSFYKKGIRFNAVAPGITATKLTGFSAEENMFSDRKCGRMFLPEEMAEVIFFLLSDASKCVSGQVFICDGGDFAR